ncbi:hypothetical protein [Pseudomonas phage PH826]|uniref:Uncharacterized protein n=2 Tax=Nankokuvirus TaxID=1925779 RepID=A0A0K0L9C5_9CAUD|nr:hypothetical protein [Pseudomonas aeruginosa]YP_009205981.1 hypothetical protein AVT15_gp016 [Pseudomonas phage vB_PaeM_PS24]QEM41054.1 hypothetical protein PAPJP_129 [Pseudomonas phage PAP-JP]UKH48012.1 MAG: hypothetical protein [Pseudomonas phage RP4]UVD32759.1 hypothetical protein [Pseudomonas phage PH826]WAB57091.1 hypothetical protein [Pseudomonas phage vB_PaeM_RP7]WAB57228.1 hypothetical protein [Pseudomonas phage vB_PaeM_RP8]
MTNMREEFEDRFPIPEGIEWRNTDYFPVQTDNVHVYVALAGAAARYSAMWQAWQASRAALKVQLPDDGIEDCQRDWQNSCRDNFDTGYCYATDRIIQALQQAGIEVEHG